METPSLIFIGSGDFGAAVLASLTQWDSIRIIAVVTQPDKPVGRSQTLTPNAVAVFAKTAQLPVLRPKKLDENFIHWLHEAKANVAIVASYGKLIPESVLAIPPKGFINVHPSLLPKYRGASPLVAALQNGDAETGVSIMLLDKGLDTGPILAQESFSVPEGIMRSELSDHLATLGGKLLHQQLLPYLKGSLAPTPQPENGISLTATLSREDGKVNWMLPAKKVMWHYQAMDKWPGTWTTWKGQTLKILKMSLIDETSPGSSGTNSLQNHQLVVQCGQGKVNLHTIQLSGKTPQPVENVLRGYPDLANSVLM